jgi:hypothetical protein
LVAFESEGYTARLVLEEFPPHQPVVFEDEPEESQKALNEMLQLNFQLRIRSQAIKEMKRSACNSVLASGVEYTMRLYKQYKVICTHP